MIADKNIMGLMISNGVRNWCYRIFLRVIKKYWYIFMVYLRLIHDALETFDPEKLDHPCYATFTALKPVSELVQSPRLLYLQHFNYLNQNVRGRSVAYWKSRSVFSSVILVLEKSDEGHLESGFRFHFRFPTGKTFISSASVIFPGCLLRLFPA